MLHLPNGEADRVMCYVSFLLQRFALTEWMVILCSSPTTADDGEAPPSAEIRTQDERYCAVLALNERWTKYSTEVRRDVLVHEILHLITRPMLHRATFWSRHLPKSLRITGFGDMIDEEELLVDRLSGILAPSLPQYPGPLSASIPNVRREGEWC